MKIRHLATLAALTTAAFGASAQQASSVTLYGMADSNFGRSETHGGVSTTGLDQVPNPRGSRFGMRGSEDLGGGMRALFQLEGAVSLTDGSTTTGNQLFNRHAWVGLSGGFGELALGRQETLHRVLNNGNYNDVATEGELSVTTSNSGLQLMQNFGTRVNQAIRYTSPEFSGIRIRVQSALGQGTTAGLNGILATYNAKNIRLALAHEYYDGSGVAGIPKWNEVTTVSGQYDMGAATIALGYQMTDKLSTATSGTSLPTNAAVLPEHTAYNIGLIYRVTQPLSLRVQYTQSTTKTPASGTTAASSRDYTRLGLSARYSMSSRTYLYAAYNERDVDVPTATANKNSMGLGISHSF